MRNMSDYCEQLALPTDGHWPACVAPFAAPAYEGRYPNRWQVEDAKASCDALEANGYIESVARQMQWPSTAACASRQMRRCHTAQPAPNSFGSGDEPLLVVFVSTEYLQLLGRCPPAAATTYIPPLPFNL